MAKLKCLVIADPSREAAEHIAAETQRLAEARPIATTGNEVLKLIAERSPEALVLSLELNHPDASEVVARIAKEKPELFVVATFRELGVPTMDKLGRAGVEDFIPQPIDFTQLFRAASNRFGTPFRRHARYPVTLEVYRADGVLIGKTRDISEGGMQMDCTHPVAEGQSLLLDLALPGEYGRVRVRCDIIAVEGAPAQTVSARGQFDTLRGETQDRLTAYLAELNQDYRD